MLSEFPRSSASLWKTAFPASWIQRLAKTSRSHFVLSPIDVLRWHLELSGRVELKIDRLDFDRKRSIDRVPITMGADRSNRFCWDRGCHRLCARYSLPWARSLIRDTGFVNETTTTCDSKASLRVSVHSFDLRVDVLRGIRSPRLSCSEDGDEADHRLNARCPARVSVMTVA